MESIAELRTICQTTAKKDISNVYMRYVCRSVSIYITRFLIPTSVTADHVSCTMILVGVFASLLLLSVNPVIFLIGVLLLQLWYVLDNVDGELARYRHFLKHKQVTSEKMELPVTGAYWDYLNHYIIHGLLPFTVGFSIYRASGNPLWIAMGFVASFGQTMMLAIYDTKSRLFLSKITRLARTSHAVSCPPQDTENKLDKVKHWSPGKWCFVILHYSVTFPTVMNILTLLGIAGFFANPLQMRMIFVIYYAIVSWAVFMRLAGKNLRNSSLDKEFDRTYIFHKTGS